MLSNTVKILKNLIKYFLILIILYFSWCFRPPIHSFYYTDIKHNVIIAKPNYFPKFKLVLEDDDPIGGYTSGIMGCLQRVSMLGGGVCIVPANAIYAGKHNHLYSLYSNTLVVIDFNNSRIKPDRYKIVEY